MDFSLDDEQAAISELTTRIVADHCHQDRLRELDLAGVSHDTDLWNELVAADVVAISLPEGVGGGGFGLTEGALVAEAVGRGPGMVPIVEATVAGRSLGRGTTDRALSLAHDVATGSALVVPALREGPTAAELTTPESMATERDGRWRVHGEKRMVFHSTPVAAYLINARTPTGVGLFIVNAADITTTDASVTTTGGAVVTLVLDDVAADAVHDLDDEEPTTTLIHELCVLRCALYAGIAAGALDLAAEHGKTREQFGAPIGTFQAVAHRLADAWLDVNLMQSTHRQAAWRSDHGLAANQASASAALWACEGGQRVVHAAQHIHGGVGMDLDYPVHRYFRWAKETDLALGGAGAAITALGAAIAAEPLTIG